VKSAEPARWPGGPGICEKENLPSHANAKAASSFHTRNDPSLSVSRQWECPHCGGVHYLSHPGGDDEVSGPLPKKHGFPFVRWDHWNRVWGSKPVQSDMPQRKLAPKPPKPEGGLF